MNTSQNDSTQPWTRQELDAMQLRLMESKRMIDAFPGTFETPCLLRKVNDDEVEACSLSGSIIVVGRDGDPPLRFPDDKSLSGKHFRILVSDDGLVYAEDLQSKNGLWFNGREVAHRLLVHGDRIHAGNQDFVFHDCKASEWTDEAEE